MFGGFLRCLEAFELVYCDVKRCFKVFWDVYKCFSVLSDVKQVARCLASTL